MGLLENDENVIGRFLTLRRCTVDDIQPLSWEQVQEIQEAGMEIGAHSYSHPNLARLPSEVQEEELHRSKEIIETRLENPVDIMAYPFGKFRHYFTEVTMKIAQKLGFRYGAAVAFRSVKPIDHPLALPRFFVTKDSVQTLSEKVYGAWDWLGWWQERAPLWLAR